MKARDIPNLLTIIRILLVFPLVGLLLQERFSLALYIMLLAGVTDLFDGYLARRNGWQSRLGSILDPIADKLLIVSIVLVLGWLDLVPSWLVVAILVRDVLIVTGVAAYHMLVGPVVIEPSRVGKISTAVQIAVCLFVVMDKVVTFVPELMLITWFFVTLGTTVLSGVDYALVWGRRAMRSGLKLRTHD